MSNSNLSGLAPEIHEQLLARFPTYAILRITFQQGIELLDGNKNVIAHWKNQTELDNYLAKKQKKKWTKIN